MTGVLINCAAVIVGSLLGLAVGKHLNENFKTVVFTCSGLVTIVMGVDMALGSSNYLALLISLLLGGFAGYLLRIEDGILAAGHGLEKLFSPKSASGSDAAASSVAGSGEKAPRGEAFARGFMNASVLFCSGAMSVVGSIQAGTTGNIQTLLIKSVMDGCMAVVFASVYGIGVMFSFLFILIYQGFFAVAGHFLEPVLGSAGISGLSAAGGVLLLQIGLGLLNIKDYRTANFLPALVFAPILEILAAKVF